jgi:phenylacetate-CoA oxygenase PaaJ subunit
VTDDLLRRLWLALQDVEDPEIPVSVVDMGLIVSLTVEADTALVQMTFTSMGCPAMDMLQHDIRARLLCEPGISRVDIQTVWDPVWTSQRLSNQAKQAMRTLGIAV